MTWDGEVFESGPFAGRRRYGCWPGSPNGTAEDETRCIRAVIPKGRMQFGIAYQCLRSRGYGEGERYCKQHGKAVNE